MSYNLSLITLSIRVFILLRNCIIFTYYCFFTFYFTVEQKLESSPITGVYSQHQQEDPFYQYQGDLFVAIDVPEEVKADLQILQARIQDILGPSFIPTNFDNFHITIQVIGKTTDYNLLEAIDFVLENVKNANAISEYNQQHDTAFSIGLELASGSVKISGKYVKLHFSSDILSNFAKKVRSELKMNGIRVDSRFDFPKKAHIALGRVYKYVDSKKKRKIKRAFDNTKDMLQTFAQDQFQVKYFSILKSNSPEPIYKRRYARIRSYQNWP